MEDFSGEQHWFNFQFAVLLASNEIDFHYYKVSTRATTYCLVQ
jgi:hypothetical protein